MQFHSLAEKQPSKAGNYLCRIRQSKALEIVLEWANFKGEWCFITYNPVTESMEKAYNVTQWAEIPQ